MILCISHSTSSGQHVTFVHSHFARIRYRIEHLWQLRRATAQLDPRLFLIVSIGHIVGCLYNVARIDNAKLVRVRTIGKWIHDDVFAHATSCLKVFLFLGLDVAACFEQVDASCIGGSLKFQI